MPLRTMSVARAGMNVASRTLDTSAHNTANMVTEGYRELDARGVETQSGVTVQIRERPREGVDPVKAAVDRRFSALMYRANLEVVKVADEMLGETTDLLA